MSVGFDRRTTEQSIAWGKMWKESNRNKRKSFNKEIRKTKYIPHLSKKPTLLRQILSWLCVYSCGLIPCRYKKRFEIKFTKTAKRKQFCWYDYHLFGGRASWSLDHGKHDGADPSSKKTYPNNLDETKFLQIFLKSLCHRSQVILTTNCLWSGTSKVLL
jgi:hypothetical protein